MNNSNETNISANMTEIEEIDKTLYRTLAQGVFIMSISTVIGSVMALFICLNVLNECKHLYKWVIRTREAEVMPPSYADATETEHHQHNLPPSYSQCVILHENPPSYSEVYGRTTSTSLVVNSCDILKSEKV